MNKEREQRMMDAAIMIAHASVNTLSTEESNVLKENGPIKGSFVCGVRWADRNPESPWVNISERLPEESLPAISKPKYALKKPIKVMLRMKNGHVMQATRRISIGGTWYFNIPIPMREQITHWMPIPPVPNVEPENKE